MEENLKVITSDKEAKAALIRGVQIAEKIVGDTMGYRGRLNLLETSGGKPTPTKDGRDSLKSIFLSDPIEALGCEMVKEAVEKTVTHAFDGTSLTTVLTYALVKHANDALESGRSPIDIKTEIENSRDKVIEYIKSVAIPATDKILYDVAWTSANSDDKIAKIVSDAFIHAGEDGDVSFVRNHTDETILDHIEGILLESGMSDERFTNKFSDRTCTFENPLIVISDINFKTNDQVIPFLDFAINNSRRPLVIVSDMEFHIREVLVRNVLEGKIKTVVVSPPGHGQRRKDFLNDLALACGTTPIDSLSGDFFQGRAHEFVGEAASVVAKKSDTIIVPVDLKSNEKVNGKIAELKEAIESTDNTLEKKYLKERITKLSGSISVIKVGGITPSEIDERLARVDDAVGACRSAKDMGVVPGGGTCMYGLSTISSLVDDITTLVLKSPLERILKNAGVSIEKDNTWLVGDIIRFFEKIFSRRKEEKITIGESYLFMGFGYDVKNYKYVPDMIDAGIVDTAKSLIYAYTNAVSVANTILMTNNVVTFKNRE